MINDIEQMRQYAFQYFSGKIQPEAEQALFAFLQTDKNAEKHFKQWEEEWFEQNKFSPEINDAWAEFVKRRNVEDSSTKVVEQENHTTQRLWHKLWLLLSTVACLLLLAGSFWFYQQEMSRIDHQTFVCSAPLGQKSKLTLPDGTTVWLNAGSSLRYTAGFGLQHRNVYLQGEGYFEVQKNTQKPFVVHTDVYNVIVTGTRFNVTAYTEDHTATTILLEGSVEIQQKNGQKYTLTPGKTFLYDRSTKRGTITTQDTVEYTGWTQGQLVYRDITLEALVRKLERAFNTTIILRTNNSDLTHKPIYFAIKNQESIDDVMNALCEILPLRVEKGNKPNEIIIHALSSPTRH